MYIGLDVGTSRTRAALIDREGRVISSCQVSYNYSDTRDGRRVLDGEEIWRAVKICLGTAGAGRQIRTITVASGGSRSSGGPGGKTAVRLYYRYGSARQRGTGRTGGVSGKKNADRNYGIEFQFYVLCA